MTSRSITPYYNQYPEQLENTMWIRPFNPYIPHDDDHIDPFNREVFHYDVPMSAYNQTKTQPHVSKMSSSTNPLFINHKVYNEFKEMEEIDNLVPFVTYGEPQYKSKRNPKPKSKPTRKTIKNGYGKKKKRNKVKKFEYYEN